MKTEDRKENCVHYILIIGVILYLLYVIIDGYCYALPDIIAIIWMIGSVIIMIIGAYKTGERIIKFKKR